MKIDIRPTAIVLLAVCAAAFPGRPVLAGQEKETPAYNVVMVFLDALRADHLRCYGYGRETAPAISALARESGVFERNFITASYTIASFASVNTSLYPASHGLREVFRDKLAPVRTMAGILGLYGYTSAWVGPDSDPHTDPATGLCRGFDELILGKCDDMAVMRTTLCEWVGKNRGKKFFLNVHTYKIHSPYCPSESYRAIFAKKKRDDVPDSRQALNEALGQCDSNPAIPQGQKMTYRNLTEYFAYWRRLRLDDPEFNAYVQTLYDACIREFDTEVLAPLIKELKALGIYDRTLIVLCADHGDEFYEHQGYGHGRTFYDEVLRTPLIIRMPGMRGKRVRELSQNVDILPTVFGLLGIPVPAQAQGKDWSGYLQGKGPAPVYQYVKGQNATMTYIRSDRWKYIATADGGEELYDLAADPREKKNVIRERESIRDALAAEMHAWEKTLPAYKEREDVYPAEIDRETQERIRKTGYW